MRPIFCGNLDFEARQSDLERLFRKYGKVERVDMKSGFAFIYMDDERDAKDAIRGLDRIVFGRKGRRLRVEWTKEERGVRRPSNPKQSSGRTKPSKTLFVINFDPYSTRTRDLEEHFDPHGKVMNIRIRRNFAFIQFETQEDATRALEATDSSKLMDRVISVEYAIKDDDDKRNGHSPQRNRDRSPGRGRERSLSPYKRERGSPDYGRGHSPSPYRRKRASPDYGRCVSRSPHRRERTGRRSRSRSPRRDRLSRERLSPEHKREPTPIDNGSPEPGMASPIRERVRASSRRDRLSGERLSPEHKREPTPIDNGSPEPGMASPIRERVRASSRRDRLSRERLSPEHKREPTPIDNGSPEPGMASPIRERVRTSSRRDRLSRERLSPEHKRKPPPIDNGSPEPGMASPIRERVRASSDDYCGGRSPDAKDEPQDNSPKYDGAESAADEKYQSHSPPERERSRS